MASAQLMQEELQQSVVLSEEDAEFEEDIPDAIMTDSNAPPPIGNSAEPEQPEQPQDNVVNYAGEVDSEVEVVPVGDFVAPEEEDDDELEDIPVSEDDDDHEHGQSHSDVEDLHDDDAFDVDAEGEEDEDADQPQIDPNTVSSDEDGAEQEVPEEDEDENEGVGAVKIKPGDTDVESESDDDISIASGSSDQESEAEWEGAVDNDDDEEEDSDAADPNNCIFCKQDEEHDPAPEFETYLTCKGCGEHAHQQCARDEGALDDKNTASNWKCPDCAGDDAGSDSEAEFERENAEGDQDIEMNGGVDESDLSPTSTNRSSAPKIARDLLPSQRGVNKPDSHSVFTQLLLEKDPMDGSRVLRKRKSSSAEAEAEAEEEVMSLRKRRKNTSDESIQDEATEEKATVTEAAVRPRLGRSLRQKAANPESLCTIVKKSRSSLVVKMQVDAAKLRKISHDSKSRKKRSGRATTSRSSRSSRNVGSTRAAAIAEPPPMAPFFASSYSQPFYSFYDKETDELKGKPYGGILTEEQADTTKTLPTKDDRRRFDEAKQKAEEEWRTRLLAMQAEAEVPLKKSRKASGPASQIECIEFGGWEIDTWYAAPYPEEYSRNRVLYICEFCLKYMNSDYVAWRHKLKCPAKHPPGDEIYRHGSISFFEVDGRKNPVYCQNLCLLAKLFLGSKTLYYDVEPFLFYVLCEYDDLGYHFVGYFSKEKRASSQNNVSCILTLPIHQRKGYGHLLIDFSYLLTKVEEKTGSPEKPLSDMGLVSYRNYWRLILCGYLLAQMPEDKSQRKGLSIRQVSDDTGMTPDDVISALEALRFLVRDPVTQVYAFRVDLDYCQKEVAKWENKKYVTLNPKNLTWTPYVMGRSNATNFELGPALNTIAPREEDEDVKAVQTLAESGIATGDFAVTQPVNQKPPAPADSSVLESTEPSDSPVDAKEDVKANENGKGNTEAPGDHPEAPSSLAGSHTNGLDDENNWFKAYDAIPVTRFQVYPPINNRRTAMSRLNSSIARPPPPPRMPPPSARRAARPKARRSTGGTTARKSTQKASSGKRKPGGTGRGPGRWPKGTKKSDYGNADSGPGLPPAWLERQKHPVGVGGKTDDNATQDTVQVQVEEATRTQKGKQVATVAARVEVSTTIENGLTPAGDGSGDVIMGEGDQAGGVGAEAGQA
ncbi:Histone acetyltransferase [Hypoxylon texense]